MALRTHRLFHLVGEFDVCVALRETDGLHVVHTAHAQPAFYDVPRQAEIVLPVGHEGHAAEMSSRGMTANIETVTITIELVGIPVDPGNTAPHLFRHNAEITASLLYCHEVQHNAVGAGIDNHFGWKCVIFCFSTKPSPAVTEYEDRC